MLSIVGDGKQVLVTARPIKRGEKVLVSNIPIGIDPTKLRQEYITKRQRLKCKCVRCNGITATPAQQQQMSTDPSFEYITRNQSHLFLIRNSYNLFAMNELIERCINFLKKYGRMNWCDELKVVLLTYQGLLFVRACGFEHGHANDGEIVEVTVPLFNV